MGTDRQGLQRHHGAAVIRWESKDGESVVRYDGFTTMVDVHRFEKSNGLTVEELDELIKILKDARRERKIHGGR